VFLGMGTTSGTQANPIVYRSWPGYTASIQCGGGPYNQNAVKIFSGTNYHYFYGFTIRQSGISDGQPIKIYGDDLKFISCFLDRISAAVRSPRVEFWDCLQDGDAGGQPSNSGDGMALYEGAQNCRIMRHVQGPNFQIGHGTLVLQDTTGAESCINNEIFSCVFHNPWSGGTQIIGGANFNHFHWNEVYDCGIDPNVQGYPVGSREGMELASTNNLIEFNYWHGNGKGISMQALVLGTAEKPKNNTIRFNTIVYNRGAGIEMTSTAAMNVQQDVVNNLIENNLIAFNGGYTASGKTCQVALRLSSGQPGTIWQTGNFYGNVFRNNLIKNVSGDHADWLMLERFPADGGYKFYTDAEIAAAGAGGNNLISVDPLLVSSSDVHLQATSPAINAGFPSGTVSGYSDPPPAYLGPAPDIGCFEYGGSD
jgi:hypothetical protein